MMRAISKLTHKYCPACVILVPILIGLFFLTTPTISAVEPAVSAGAAAASGYDVQGYTVEGRVMLATNVLTRVFSKYTGTNVSLQQIVRAAGDLQAAYQDAGYSTINIVIASKRITNGIVTMDVFQGAMAQIVVSGRRYLNSGILAETETNVPAMEAPPLQESNTVATVTNTPPPPSFIPPTPATPEQIAQARAALVKSMFTPPDTRIHVVSTNAGPHFEVKKYLITGNTVLTPDAMAMAVTNIDGAYGTNVSLAGIRTVVEQLQGAYRDRGYVTVAVGLPQQKLTNASVKIQVTEGRLVGIDVKGNRYFSSNNVMRALPGMYTNMVLNGLVFQAELNRANANRDRQIYPVVSPGPDPGTSELTLRVKDQLPLHGKVDLNNENSPGTPDLRVNSSIVADNLWQRDQSLGLQYGFSPEDYKKGQQWDFYDLPLVANYSAFYRIPLGSPASIEDQIASNPNSFGYDEATRKFNLPPPSGQPELNLYASRSTIDTGLSTSPSKTLFSTQTTNADQTIVTNTTLTTDTQQQDLTVNNDVGFRLSVPFSSASGINSSVSGGLDFKTYNVTSSATNNFYSYTLETIYGSPPFTVPVTSVDHSPVPLTVKGLNYLPLSLRYDAGWRDAFGAASFGMGLSANLWLSGVTTATGSGTNGPVTTYYHGVKSLQQITGSTESSGYWAIVTPSFTQNFEVISNWPATFRADGQWASEPLISNEQFGAGGVNSVRGYHEGEVFGDTGWHVSLEQMTPPRVVGMVYGNAPLTIRGSIYMDYARVFLLDPHGSPSSTPLWGTGVGFVASAGPHWAARFLFSLPLLSAGSTESFQPYFNFGLTAQF